MKSTITEINNSLDGFNRFQLAEERIRKFEDSSIESMQAENESKRMKKNEQSLREMWDTIKCTDTGVMRIPEERRE